MNFRRNQDCIDYFRESEKYKLDVVKILLVAEAPPPSGKAYFYVPKAMSIKRSIRVDWSLPATIFHHYFRERYTELLNMLRDKGIFLMDMVDTPIKISDRKQKGRIVRENFDNLVGKIPELRNRIRSRGIEIDDEDIIFLLPRSHYKKNLDAEFPDSRKIKWIDFRMNPAGGIKC